VVDNRPTGDDAFVLLRVIPDRHADAGAPGARRRLAQAGQEAQEAGLAGPVKAHHEKPLAALDRESDILEHRWAVVGLGQGVRLEDDAPAVGRWGKLIR